MERTWTITELAERAVEALAAGESVRVNGRVRDMPNERLIRWYTTIGLVDPPLGRRGRTALYGMRHLLQLVAVKRRQAEGRSLAEIQAELAGATDHRLSEIARLPAPATPSSQPQVQPRAQPQAQRRSQGQAQSSPTSPPSNETAETGAAPPPPPSRARFWAAQPAPAAPPAASSENGSANTTAQAVSLVQGIRLAAGLTLLLEAPGPRVPDGDDLSAIETAARPLLDELRRRGLLDRPSQHPDPPGRPQ